MPVWSQCNHSVGASLSREVALAQVRAQLEADGIGGALVARFAAIADDLAAEFAAAPLADTLPQGVCGSLLHAVEPLKIAGGENEGLTWASAALQAAAAGARLPLIAQLRAAAEVLPEILEPGDLWGPVRRTDGVEQDWVGFNNQSAASYNSHLDRHKSIPPWGSDGG